MLSSAKTRRVSDDDVSEAGPQWHGTEDKATWGHSNFQRSGYRQVGTALWATGGQGNTVTNGLPDHICSRLLVELSWAEPWQDGTLWTSSVPIVGSPVASGQMLRYGLGA